jgi:hypothetical protein
MTKLGVHTYDSISLHAAAAAQADNKPTVQPGHQPNAITIANSIVVIEGSMLHLPILY